MSALVIQAEMDFEPIYIADKDTDIPLVKIYRFGKVQEELALAQSIRNMMTPQGSIAMLAIKLKAGVASDIWYDHETFGDENNEAEAIEHVQNAMTESANLLLSLMTVLTEAEAKIVGLYNDIAPSSEGRFADKDPVVQKIRKLLE